MSATLSRFVVLSPRTGSRSKDPRHRTGGNALEAWRLLSVRGILPFRHLPLLPELIEKRLKRRLRLELGQQRIPLEPRVAGEAVLGGFIEPFERCVRHIELRVSRS